jgi:hypothetical protein
MVSSSSRVRRARQHGSVPGELESLAYALSWRSLRQQEGVLTELRTRSGVLLGATAFVASFLGGRALDTGVSWLAIPGLALALVSLALAIYVLAPKGDLNFSIHGDAVYEHFMNEGVDLAETHRTLAYWIRGAWDGNQTIIDRLVRVFWWACAALFSSLLLWSLALALD